MDLSLFFAGISGSSTADAASQSTIFIEAQRREGFFSQQADKVVITDLKQVAWATTAGEFNLNGLSLRLKWGKDECF